MALTLAGLLIDLGAAGVALRVRRGVLQIRCTDEQAPRIEPYRAALLGLLNGYEPSGAEEGIVFEERLGVAEGLGMPTAPGSPGWLIAVGEAIRAEEADQAARPGIDITPQRLAKWHATAGQAGDPCAQAARFVQEVWKRIHRLEHKGVERAAAIAAVLDAMEAANKTAYPRPERASGGCVNCQTATRKHGQAQR